MTIGEVTERQTADFCGVSIDEEAEQAELLKICGKAAAAFIKGYTGLDDEGINKHEDLTTAYLVLVNEMYTKRDYTVDSANINPIVKQIASMHSVNYL